MSDEGIRAREKVERQIELRLQKTYTEAQKDILKKLDGFISKHKEKDKAMRRKLDDGEISNEDYQYWLARQVFIGAQWEEKVREITNRLTDIRGDDLKMIHDREIGVFADNANYQAYKMEHDIGKSFRFDIYDERTVRNLVANKPALLPEKIVDRKKHNHWNQGIIANCITQGIVQGESIPKIARRIANATANRNLTASTLYARTAMTCAQNAGRMERLRESKEMGINVKKQWLATHDSRTRDSHIHLDGQVREVEKPFDSDFGKIDFPGDPHAEPADVYNCRCTLVYVYPDYEELDHFEDNPEAEQMSFDEWSKNQSAGISENASSQTGGNHFYSKNAKSNREIVEQLEKAGYIEAGKGSTLEGIDVECSKMIYDCYKRSFERFPFLESWDFSGIETYNLDSKTYADCLKKNGHIRVCLANFSGKSLLDANYADDVKSGYHPRGTTSEAIIFHEIGHRIEAIISEEAGLPVEGFANAMLDRVLNRGKLRPWRTFEKDEVNSQISIYAAKDADEMFAECFATYMTAPEDSMSEMQKAWNILFEEAIGRYF